MPFLFISASGFNLGEKRVEVIGNFYRAINLVYALNGSFKQRRESGQMERESPVLAQEGCSDL